MDAPATLTTTVNPEDFVRSRASIHPHEIVTLSDELALQSALEDVRQEFREAVQEATEAGALRLDAPKLNYAFDLVCKAVAIYEGLRRSLRVRSLKVTVFATEEGGLEAVLRYPTGRLTIFFAPECIYTVGVDGDEITFREEQPWP